MPFDERAHVALRALARPIAEFRLTIDGALAQARAFLADAEQDPLARAARARLELGAFGERSLDAAGFAALFAPAAGQGLAYPDRFRAAVETLEEVLARGEGLFVTQVPAGGSLARAVEDALSRIGRAFGAVLAVELLRGGAYRPEEHDGLLERLAFRSWTRTERRYAPPLIVLVNGSDLQVGGLADYTDGRERIVLVVTGECPPAPLVRLITPGAMVLQTADGANLELIPLYDGPAIAAMVPPSAARFVHDPRAGRETWQRLSVTHQPPAPKHSIGGASPWQLAEDLKQLAALASAPTLVTGGALAGAVVAESDAVDRLATWLLRQADLTGIG